MITTRFAFAAVAALGMTCGTALAQTTTAPTTTEGAAAPAGEQAFTAENAALDGQQLTVDVMSPQAGWAVIHTVNADGTAGDHIGHAAIESGQNEGVQITLDQAPDGELIVMLHEDAGAEGEFEFGPDTKTDAPVMKDGEPVTDEIEVGS